jgi:hypothetical protein
MLVRPAVRLAMLTVFLFYDKLKYLEKYQRAFFNLMKPKQFKGPFV